MPGTDRTNKGIFPLLVHPDTERAGDIFHCCVHRDLRVQHIPRSFLHRAARLGVVLRIPCSSGRQLYGNHAAWLDLSTAEAPAGCNTQGLVVASSQNGYD